MVKVVRYSPNIHGDIVRGWSAWMGGRSTSKEDAVLMAFEYQGHGGQHEMDERFENDDSYESADDWARYIDDLAEELDVRFDDNTGEWCVVHHDGLSCYVVNDGTYTDEEEAELIARHANGVPIGDGQQTVGAVTHLADLGDNWHLLECQDYAHEL